MSLYDERVADLKEIEADLPNTFQHGTDASQVSGACIPTMQRAGFNLMIGGKLVTIRRTLFIRCELFTAGAPVQMQPIKFRSDTVGDFTEYRIADVKQAADLAHYEIAITGLNEL